MIEHYRALPRQANGLTDSTAYMPLVFRLDIDNTFAPSHTFTFAYRIGKKINITPFLASLFLHLV